MLKTTINTICIAVLLIFAIACNQVKETAKDAVNTAGDAAGQAVGEFGKGVGEGVDKALEVKPEFAASFLANGLKTGDVKVTSDSVGTDNVLNIYVVFEKACKCFATAKVYNAKGLEMGRCKTYVEGNKDDAKYIQFTFDKLTNIDADSKIVVE
jgi:hypothetical protein